MRSIRTHSATEAAGETIAVRLGKLSGSSRLVGCTYYAHSMGTWIRLIIIISPVLGFVCLDELCQRR